MPLISFLYTLDDLLNTLDLVCVLQTVDLEVQNVADPISKFPKTTNNVAQ